MRRKRDEPTPDQRIARLARRRHGVALCGESAASLEELDARAAEEILTLVA